MIALSPLLMLAGVVESSKMAKEKSNVQVKGTEIIPETLNNLKVVRSLTAESQILNRYEGLVEEERLKGNSSAIF